MEEIGPIDFAIIVITYLFSKLPWSGDSKDTLCSSSHIPTAAHLSTTHGGRFALYLFIAERQAGKLQIPIFL